MTPTELIEAAAKAIDPKPFRAWQGTFDAVIRDGGSDEQAKIVADKSHLASMNEARADARAAASIIIEACAAEAENAVSAECCGNPIEGGDPEVGSRPECCGSPTLVLRYPNGIAAAIRSLAPVKEG